MYCFKSRVFVAGSALKFSIFMDRIAAKNGSNSFMVSFLAPFFSVVCSLPPLLGQWTEKGSSQFTYCK